MGKFSKPDELYGQILTRPCGMSSVQCKKIPVDWGKPNPKGQIMGPDWLPQKEEIEKTR